ncbi:hypothetical protein RvY_05808 [Ramazzottius varieornatus]|uniref:Uncharacterized protein n=1 Tax=Ramazzottius varieornatus TaxID=947166 RepID=A0A1D1V2Z5_RAMVA|nr:hypothetical protein RvY_05808 [Ramazzottius varieornatus]
MTVEQPVEFKQLDEILQLLGDPGRFQIIQFIVISFTYIPLAVNDFVVIFYGLPPTSVRCHGDPLESLLEVVRRNTTAGNVSSAVVNSSDPACHCPHGFEYSYPGRQWSIIGDVRNAARFTVQRRHPFR